MNFSISIPEDQVTEIEQRIGRQSTKQAIFQAVFRTTRAGVVIVRKRVQEKLAISQKYITRVVRVQMRGGDFGAQGHILVTNESVPIAAYPAVKIGMQGPPEAGQKSVPGGGLLVTMSRDRPPVFFRHAFFARVGTGRHKGVFWRAEGRDSSGTLREIATHRTLRTHKYEGGRLTARGYARRLPIEQVFGATVAETIGVEEFTKVGELIRDDLAAKLAENMNSQFDRFLGRKKGERLPGSFGAVVMSMATDTSDMQESASP